MPVEGTVSEPLYSLLEFESLKHGIPIRYRQTDLRYWRTPDRFEPLLDVVVHTDPTPLPFAVPAGEVLLKVRAAVYEHELPNPVGPTIGDTLLPLSYVQGRCILIPYDLEDLENLNGIPNPINRLWDQIAQWALPAAVGVVKSYDWAAEKAAYRQAKVYALEQSITGMERAITDNEYDIENHTAQIIELVRKNDELKTSVTLFRSAGREEREVEADREFDDLRRLVPGAYRRIDVGSESLVAETGPISIEFEGTDYDLGRFQVTLPFFSERLTIKNLDRVVEGYHHPHVDGSGHPCLGNISLSLTKLLTLKQYPQALILIRRFLESYNAENPYQSIERWNPDHEDDEEDDDEDDNCYAASSTRDCVECRNEDCRFWEDRYVRCAEINDLETCLSCQECETWEQRVQSCWDRTEPRETCMGDCNLRECPHWRDADDCWVSHNGEDCEDCEHTDCTNHPEREEETDDSSADRPADS